MRVGEGLVLPPAAVPVGLACVCTDTESADRMQFSASTTVPWTATLVSRRFLGNRSTSVRLVGVKLVSLVKATTTVSPCWKMQELPSAEKEVRRMDIDPGAPR